MAITSARMQIKRGNEVDFDAEKMLVGEWALSTDKRIVRICVAPNVCIRMATYDAFEVDMAKIEKILEECQTIEGVVKLINSQVSEKLELTIEYTNQAKQYRDETEQFRNEVESMVDVGIATTERAGIVKPDGSTIRVDEDGTIHADNGTVDYNELENKPFVNGMELSGNKSLDELGIASVEALEETNSKVNIIIEKAELNIKNSASGENLHLTDSANGKNVGFGLYGKAEQKQYSGKNLIPYPFHDKDKVSNGVTFTVSENGYIVANGTSNSTSNSLFSVCGQMTFKPGSYILSGCPIGGGTSSGGGTYRLRLGTGVNNGFLGHDIGNGFSFTLDEDTSITLLVQVFNGYTANNLTFKPMIRLASITDDTWEPYVGGTPSPNPDYPQEITVSGSDGSVEVKSVGKNLLKNNATSKTASGITFTVNDGSVTANGTATGNAFFDVGSNFVLPKGDYILSQGFDTFDGDTRIQIVKNDAVSTYIAGTSAVGRSEVVFSLTEAVDCIVRLRIKNGYTANNLVFKPMIRLASDTDDTFEPYKETTSTIPTPDGLSGIKVSSGGNYTDENGQQWICDEVVKYADGSGKRIQRIAKHIVESCASYNAPRAIVALPYMMKMYTAESNIYSICNRFNAVKHTVIVTNTDNSCGGQDKTYAFRADSLGLTSADEWTTWFNENETIIYYVLAEPIITDLSAEEIAEIEKLYTFYPVTNISNDADCGMSITYMADAKNYIDNRLALIESAMLNNI